MANLNEVRLIGNLTRDPELRAIPSGAQIANFGLATNRRFKGQDGVQREEVTFVDITAWGKTAELCGQYLRKGRSVYIGGRLKFESWEDRNTGQKRSKLSVTAENIQFLDGGKREDGQSYQGNQGQAYQREAQPAHAPTQDVYEPPYDEPFDEPPF